MAATDAHGLAGLASLSNDAADQRIDRRTNATSPGPSSQQSKRDKKRQLLTDRLAALSDKFSRDRDMTYREQLQKIQIDTNLVMRLDPYADRPLDFLGPDRHSRDREYNRDPDPDARGGGRGLLEMAGPTFQQWLQEIEDLVEERDAELTKQKYEFDKKAQEHKNTHLFKSTTANREHHQLATTLRDRLTNAITAKKVRLTKEKEALEIADASALLLHPNQFSLTNPSSPGGTHGKRATRLRQAAADDNLRSDGNGGSGGNGGGSNAAGGNGGSGGGGGGSDNRKRKRNGGDDDGSPAPQRRGEGGSNGTTPFWHGDRLTNRSVAGPVYSIDKLFTDKELALTYNAAALASHKYLLSHRRKRNQGASGGASDTESGDGGGGDDDDDDYDYDDPRDVTPALAAAIMERVPSHATRSTRGGGNNGANNNTGGDHDDHHGSGGGGGGSGSGHFVDDKIVGLEALSGFAMPRALAKLVVHEPKMPPLFMSNYAKPHNKIDANTPATLPVDDISSDLAVMRLLRQYERSHGTGSNFDNANGGRKVLEATAFSRQHGARHVAYLQHERRADPEQALRRDLRLPASAAGGASTAANGVGSNHSNVRDEPPATPRAHHGHGHNSHHDAAAGGGGSSLHATPMSRQSSLGGAAMSRQGSNTRAQRKRN